MFLLTREFCPLFVLYCVKKAVFYRLNLLSCRRARAALTPLQRPHPPPAISSVAAVCPEVYNYTFETGARTVWHSHAGGQLILVTDGTGYYQEEGGDIQAYLWLNGRVGWLMPTFGRPAVPYKFVTDGVLYKRIFFQIFKRSLADQTLFLHIYSSINVRLHI